jgi:hypothetical protein
MGLGEILNAVGLPNQALLFRHLQGLQHLVKGRAEIKRLAEFAARAMTVQLGPIR